MKVLVINCGSSSLKYQLIDMTDESVLAIGLVERIGIEGSVLKHEIPGRDKQIIEEPMTDHKDALKHVLDALVNPEYGAIKSMDEINAVGHRVVHAGEKFASSVVITDEVVKALEDCIELAPLHNPPNLIGINACREILPTVPMVAVFDTAFHQTMPPKAYMYALPYEYYEKYSIRRYGFHGTSHRYVSKRAAAFLGKNLKDLKVITCHLGNGSSFAAVKNGKCVDTSMGLTPLAGICMGTRCGDIDPAIVPIIMEKEGLTASQVDDLMNKKSGVQGLSGVSSDFRDLSKAAKEGNERAALALEMFEYQAKKIIGSYAAAMGGVDVIVFTAGIGENSDYIREAVCEDMEFFGIEIDKKVNDGNRKESIISKPSSKVTVVVIPTNEELAIAKETEALVK